jgi:hypothetical protein
MKLIQVIESVDDANEDETIYAVEPWSCDSEAAVALEPDDGGLPVAVANRGMRYFLEVSIAKEFLESLDQTTSQAKCERLIQYALTDA